jgi:hypothetical protein
MRSVTAAMAGSIAQHSLTSPGWIDSLPVFGM